MDTARHIGRDPGQAPEPDVKRALLVGIDRYANFPPLSGAVNDVEALAPLLERHHDGSPNYACRTLLDASRDELLEELDVLLDGPGGQALFYFAGHGAERAADVTLATRDGTRRSPGVPFFEVLELINASSSTEVIVILDCCFAGAAGRVPRLGDPGSVVRDGVIILAASRPQELSAEMNGRGRFSSFLEEALHGAGADVRGRVTIAGVYAHVAEGFGAFSQRPMLKSSIYSLDVLRQCASAIRDPELEMLPRLFVEDRTELQLDPSYEPTAEPRDPDHEALFAILQRYRAAGLVEPVAAEHMYDAAMGSTACRLTALGRRYWRTAKGSF